MSKPLHSSTAVLIGAFLCILLNPAVVGFYSFTIFFNALSADLGYGRGVMALSITLGTLIIAVVAPIAGGYADRGGARRLVVFSSALLAALLALMPVLCKSLIGLYLAFILLGVLAACYYVALPRIISSWFDARRGLALGVVMSGAGLGSALLAPATAGIITQYGWPMAYLALAGAVLVVAFPAALFLVHEHPAATVAHEQKAVEKPKVTGELVLFAAAFFLMGAGLHGVLINFSPILTDRGLTSAQAAEVFAMAGIAMFIGRIGCGFMLDLLPANRIGAVLILGSALGVAMLYHTNNPVYLYAAACLFGLGVSAELDLLSYIISRRYPIAYFSRFFSIVYATFMVGTSIGPPLVGGLYDVFGDYRIGTLASAGLLALAALSLALLPKTPTRSRRREEATIQSADVAAK